MQIDYTVGQYVEIANTGVIGRIRQVLIGEDDVQFNISYWKDDMRKSEWISSDEILCVRKTAEDNLQETSAE